MRRTYSQFFLIGCCLALVMSSSLASAQDSVVLDFPRMESADQKLPLGLLNWPEEGQDGLCSISIPLLPLNDEGSLVVTAVFRDEVDRIVLAKWVGPDQSVAVLSANLSEGIQGWNQRAFKVPFELLQLGGTIVIETDAEIQPVRRLVLNWGWPSGVASGVAGNSVEFIKSASSTLTREDLAPVQNSPRPDSWAGGVWKAFLNEVPESFAEGVEFIVPIQADLRTTVLRAEVLGVPLDATLEIWINGQKLPSVSPEIPELTSEGYFSEANGTLAYAGWRKSAVIIPANYLKRGDNSVVIGGQSGAYIKKAMFELNFKKDESPFLSVAGDALFSTSAMDVTEVAQTEEPSAYDSTLPEVIVVSRNNPVSQP